MFNNGGMLTGDKIRKEVQKGKITITEFDDSRVNPNSYNLRLHPQLKIYKRDADRSGLTKSKKYKAIQAGLDQPDSLINMMESIIGRFRKEGDAGSSKRHKPNVNKNMEILHEDHPNSTSGNKNCDKIYIKGSEGIGYSPTSAIINEYASMNIVDNKISSVSDSLDNLRERIFRSMKATVQNSSRDIKTLYRNQLILEKNINTIGLYPNVSSLALEPLDMKKENETIEFEIPEEGYVLQPGVLYIGRTKERTCTDKYIPMINGRSSGGRLGISIHICAGFGDIGFDGTWTLEITCVEPVRIYPDTEIAQVCFFKPCGKVKELYRGRYYQQEEATASRFSREKGDNRNYVGDGEC